MKRLTIFLSLILSTSLCFADQPSKEIVGRLKQKLAKKEQYSEAKIEGIKSLKLLLEEESDIQVVYSINQRLLDEYWKFQTDSAIRYGEANREILSTIVNREQQIENMLKLAWLYSAKGEIVEAKQLLDKIDPKRLPKSMVQRYYETNYDYYSHVAFRDVGQFEESRTAYRDTLLSVLDRESVRYNLINAQKILYDTHDSYQAEKILLQQLKVVEDGDSDKSIIEYLLGYIYREWGNVGKAVDYFALSAIGDIESVNRDNAAFHNLALIYYEQGNVDMAYSLINAALSDAMSCGILYRSIESTEFYPLISSTYQAKEEAQKQKLLISLIVIAVLSLVLAGLVGYTYKQVRKLSQTKGELYATNDKLHELNEDLQEMNLILGEANHVKEEYIARFFDICSEYIDKLEGYRSNLYQKLRDNDMKELSRIIRSTNLVQQEVEALYENFDSIFLNIYPTFVDEFNALLQPGEEIVPKNELSLNTELRIYALIRLGITDSVKIANFLRYSIRTVYNYRTRLRNKSAVPRDDFEEEVQKIGAFKEIV